MPNKCLDDILARREEDSKVVVGEVKRIILDTLKPETLEKLQKGKYNLRSVYPVDYAPSLMGFSESSLYDCIKEHDKRFNDHDINIALKDLESSDKVKSTVLDLSSVHNPDSKYTTIYYLPKSN